MLADLERCEGDSTEYCTAFGVSKADIFTWVRIWGERHGRQRMMKRNPSVDTVPVGR